MGVIRFRYGQRGLAVVCSALYLLTVQSALFLRADVTRGGTGPRSHLAIAAKGTSRQTVPGAPSPLCVQPGENCQAPDISDALTSDRVSFRVADDFTPHAGGNVAEVCWRGTYYDGGVDCQGVAPDAFEVAYYADDGGVPGTLLASFSQAMGTLSVTGPVATGALIAGLVPEYEYKAIHDPLPVEADQCYWIEITNSIANCTWFWESAAPGDRWAVQDGDGASPPDGYDLGDSLAEDLAFCLDAALGDSVACTPPPLPNDDCSDATPISGEGTFAFNNTAATTDGLAHDACLWFGERQIENDVWYCWTASCAARVFVATCALTEVDTKIAVYERCSCPATDPALLACNDDLCGATTDPRQSMVAFDALPGQQYLIRIGNYPGERQGPGSFLVSCGPPDQPSCPGTADCCEAATTPGCSDEVCCETVCACDPFCCEVFWDDACAESGFQGNGCGAWALCEELCGVCGVPAAGDCCQGNGTPGCDDGPCCRAVCDCDAFCCQVEWDDNCASSGFQNSGCGAGVLCEDLCPGPDCNENGVPDDQDIAGGTSQDCQPDGIPDECQVPPIDPTGPDCNGNLVPDECEPDSDGDGWIDACDGCPSDPEKIDPGECGCGQADTDTDMDGLADCVDADDDNDGVADPSDTDALDPDVCEDSDTDGCDDCSLGSDDFGPLPDNDPTNDGVDTDGDGICNAGDSDDDNDGISDPDDTDALDPDVCEDSDADGCDDCAIGTDDFGPAPDHDPANDGPDQDRDGICDASDTDIPTLSAWGLLATALMILAVGRICFSRNHSRAETRPSA